MQPEFNSNNSNQSQRRQWLAGQLNKLIEFVLGVRGKEKRNP
jgi:hypothetical protein